MTNFRFISKLIIPIILFVVSYIAYKFISFEHPLSSYQEKIQEQFTLHEKNLSLQLKDLEKNIVKDTLKLKNLCQSNYVFLIFKNKSLVYWNNNLFPIDKNPSTYLLSNKCVLNLNQASFYVECIESNDTIFVGLLPIYREYPFNNSYLKNGFSEIFKVPDFIKANLHEEVGLPIKNTYGEKIFSISKITQPARKKSELLIFFLWSISYFLFCYFFLSVLNSFFKNTSLGLIIPIIIVFLTHIAIVAFKIPQFIFKFEIFKPEFFAWNSLFDSPGTLILNSSILLITSLWLYLKTQNKNLKVSNYASVLLIIFNLLFFIFHSVLTEATVNNSMFYLNIYELLKINLYDILAILSIIFVSLSYLFFNISICFFCKNSINKTVYLVNITVLPIIVGSIYNSLLSSLIIWFLIMIITFLNKKSSLINVSNVILVVLITLSTWIILTTNNEKKLIQNLELYTLKIAGEQDPIFEYLIKNVDEEIKHDTLLNKYIFLQNKSNDEILQYLKNNYFIGYFTQYHTQITLCRENDELMVIPSNFKTNCFSYFKDLNERMGRHTMIENLYYLDDGSGNPNYLYEVNLKNRNNNQDSIKLFIDFVSVPKVANLGFPELLFDEKIVKKVQNYQINYARYYNNRLITQIGTYQYPTELNETIFKNNAFIEKDGLIHYTLKISDKRTVISSLPQITLFEKISNLSYILIISILFLLFFEISIKILEGGKKLSGLNLKFRLQLFNIFIVVICFLIAAIVTYNFFVNYQKKKNIEFIREKTLSLLVELDHKIGKLETIKNNDASLEELVIKFSNVFFTDINIFNIKGELLATSRPQIFQQGLISSMMNYEILMQLTKHKSSFLIQEEQIGNLKYTSVYAPVRNYKNEVIAYLNLPYFAKETEFKNEISSVLLSLTNFYVLAMTIAILFAIFSSNYITTPLKYLTQHLRKLKPGASNEKLVWKRDDEIGELVKVYNRMVDELNESTRKLMESERESTWKEMAKQIAHEIKNPLTPMKLSLQNLQKAWNEKAPDYEERFKRTSKIIIEQIDMLEQIASQFSAIAKMSSAPKSNLNLNSLIQDVIALYTEDFYEINFISANYDIEIFANELEIKQILHNLIKNAIQSIPSSRKGFIVIELSKNLNKIVLKISDNGIGMTEEVKNKLFTPHFTSKTEGSGLGLYIVKQILSHYEATIKVESTLDAGTTFTIEFCNSQDFI